MKKLIQTTMPVLFLLSLIFSACDKPVVEPPKPDKNHGADFWINYKWTPKDKTNPDVRGTGNVAEGENNVEYTLDPYLHGSGICPNGTWTYTIESSKDATPTISQDAKGIVTFMPYSGGLYKITIMYNCPGWNKVYSQTITINVKGV